MAVRKADISFEKASIREGKEKKKKNFLPSTGRVVHLRSSSASVFISKLKQFTGLIQTLDVNPPEV